MELDNLKTIWKEQETLAPVTDPEHLAWLLQMKSRGPIARMRRNLRVEALLMVITYIPTIIAYLVLFAGRLSLISLFLFVVLCFYAVYFYRKDRLLIKMQCVTCEVRSNLAGQVKALRKYIRFYIWSGTLVILIAMVVACCTIRYAMQLKSMPIHWWFEPPFLLAILTPFAFGLLHLNKWYASKLYGRHIEKLDAMLREMDED
ncbi:MAG TPA: hypothetical protein VGQ51_01690 [Puia sp.]|jgi:hypothetical protein|nr:hypothetical protein [Puia sp.]